MSDIKNHVLSIEAGKKIREYLGEDTPESYFIFTNMRNPSIMPFEAEDWTEDQKKTLVPMFLFSELINEVLPLIAKKKSKNTYYDKQDLFDVLTLGGMEAVSKQIISLINETKGILMVTTN